MKARSLARRQALEALLPENLPPEKQREFMVALSQGITEGKEFREIISGLTPFEKMQYFSDAELIGAFVDSAKGFYRAEFFIDSLAALSKIVRDPASRRSDVMKAIRQQAEILGEITKAPQVVVDRSQHLNQTADEIYMDHSRSKAQGDGGE